jgi:hypothetical protein
VFGLYLVLMVINSKRMIETTCKGGRRFS